MHSWEMRELRFVGLKMGSMLTVAEVCWGFFRDKEIWGFGGLGEKLREMGLLGFQEREG